MKLKSLFITILSVGILCSCALRKPTIVQYEPITPYKFVYIPHTNDLSSSAGGTFGTQYGIYGYNISKSINPKDVISGYLMKQGFVILPEIRPERLKETIIVNYGETGRRSLNLGYTIEITLQFISAHDHKVLCTCTAEGQGSTEADDIREAITRALNGLFSANNN